MTGQEKRKFPRYELMKGRVRYKAPSSQMDIGMASIKNISGGGLCLLTVDKIENGLTLHVDFELPEEKLGASALCKVVWVDELEQAIDEEEMQYKYQIGVKFLEIDRKVKEEIIHLVVKRLKTRVQEELKRRDEEAGAVDVGRIYSILVIDDDKVTRKMVEDVFAPEFNVITAADGHEGVQKALEWQPDLILLDIIMPDMDGFSTLMLLKDMEETRDIPVMMLSMVRQKSKIFQAIRDGAQDFIIKPFTAERLLNKIRKSIQAR